MYSTRREDLGAIFKAGLERARAKGKRLGRPKVSKDVERRILRERQKGTGILAIAKQLGVGTSVVQRVIAIG